ncbi:hypothetical protein NMY22_g18998 [Coprinellus aureogranulatus]|nr:hypothetical protein NMY22_g18998 [Coprinellus aureogranulatus]
MDSDEYKALAAFPTSQQLEDYSLSTPTPVESPTPDAMLGKSHRGSTPPHSSELEEESDFMKKQSGLKIDGLPDDVLLHIFACIGHYSAAGSFRDALRRLSCLSPMENTLSVNHCLSLWTNVCIA